MRDVYRLTARARAAKRENDVIERCYWKRIQINEPNERGNCADKRLSKNSLLAWRKYTIHSVHLKGAGR